jgi:hypothetical protein
MNLDQLAGNAARVIVGTCLGMSESATAEGIPFTEYSFDVDEVLRGSAGQRLTVRQFGRPNSAEVNGYTQVLKVQGMPSYKPGDRVLLFLTAESSIGLSAPVGLFQGAFKVGTGANGDLEAVNSADNVGLFLGMEELPQAAARHRRGAANLSLIRQLIQQRGQ